MVVIELNEKLLTEVGRDIGILKNKVVDISKAPKKLADHLNPEIAESLGITKEHLAVQVAEDRIRSLALEAGVGVICLYIEQMNPAFETLIEKLREDRIVLLK